MIKWMLHGNVSRKGYGNALIGRYGGCFEEGYNEVYDDRAYRAKVLDVPAKVDANSRSEKKAMHGTGEARKIWVGGSVNFQYLHYSEELMHLLSVTLNLIRRFHKETSTPRRSVWGFGYPCASSTHCTCVFSNIRPLKRVVTHLVARVLN